MLSLLSVCKGSLGTGNRAAEAGINGDRLADRPGRGLERRLYLVVVAPAPENVQMKVALRARGKSLPEIVYRVGLERRNTVSGRVRSDKRRTAQVKGALEPGRPPKSTAARASVSSMG